MDNTTKLFKFPLMIFLIWLWIIIIVFVGGWVFLKYIAEKENEAELIWGYVHLVSIWLVPFFVLTMLGAAIIVGCFKLYQKCKPFITKVARWRFR